MSQQTLADERLRQARLALRWIRLNPFSTSREIAAAMGYSVGVWNQVRSYAVGEECSRLYAGNALVMTHGNRQAYWFITGREDAAFLEMLRLAGPANRRDITNGERASMAILRDSSVPQRRALWAALNDKYQRALGQSPFIGSMRDWVDQERMNARAEAEQVRARRGLSVD